MASGKQRRKAIKAKRSVNKAKAEAQKPACEPNPLPSGSAPVNEALLAPNNSYGAPDFVYRGHYLDTAFTCGNCGKEEIWTANQQKWWFEVAKGFAYSTAKLCRACRALVRAQKDESRRAHREGAARKKAASPVTPNRRGAEAQRNPRRGKQ
jgi:hypothetical protein